MKRIMSRRKTPWEGVANLNATQTFLKENYVEDYEARHSKDTRTNVTHNTLFDTFDLMVDNLKLYFAELKLLPRKLIKLCLHIY